LPFLENNLMNPYIKNWTKRICKKLGLSAFYLPNKDVFMLHFKGRALQGFNSQVFWQIPPDAREKMLTPIMKLGLNNNIDEKNRDNLFTKKKLGKLIYSSE
jgi:hypothetical protein